MRLLFRKSAEVAVEPPSFGPWALHQFAAGASIGALTPEGLAQISADTSAIVIGAAYAYSDLLLAMFEPTAASLEESTQLAHLTQAGFEKIAANPATGESGTSGGNGGRGLVQSHQLEAVAGVWPWEHLAARLAAQTAEGQLEASEQAIGTAILETATVYVLSHREQLTSVLDLWYRVVEELPAGVVAGKQDLVRTGAYLLEQFHEEYGLAEAFAEAKAGHDLPAAGRPANSGAFGR